MSGYLIILLVLTIYIIGVFMSLFLGMFLSKKCLQEGEYLQEGDLPGLFPLLSWFFVIIILAMILIDICEYLSKIGTLFNRIAIWYYGDKWYEAKKEN